MSIHELASVRDIKAVSTAASVVWHALAVMVGTDIAKWIFSAEWAFHYRRLGSLEPGKIDKVSTITSGVLERISYSLSKDTTPGFRLSFVVTLLLLLLGPIGPGAMTVDFIWIDATIPFSVADLGVFETMDTSNLRKIRSTTLQRAERFLTSEYLDHSVASYETLAARTLIPWPVDMTRNLPQSITYESDVATYKYDCRWVAPLLLQGPQPFYSAGYTDGVMPGDEILFNDTGGTYTGNQVLGPGSHLGTGDPWVSGGPPLPLPAKTRTLAQGYGLPAPTGEGIPAGSEGTSTRRVHRKGLYMQRVRHDIGYA
ncbi:hypothetical protein NP233_g1902 [Leucocoprinus birnbaumii]|uniref:Uncharacterized protein n=1 Tax=Leucocoprinus birnbaumii TaxID=56174 RepID=A0AAD5YZ71_9AGAR|nr:hypothetical protein NP233_g1902 [Leucocoprinus birnbaumii]